MENAQQYWIDLPTSLPERLFVKRFLRENEIMGCFDHWGLSVFAMPEQIEAMSQGFFGSHPDGRLAVYDRDGKLVSLSLIDDPNTFNL